MPILTGGAELPTLCSNDWWASHTRDIRIKASLRCSIFYNGSFGEKKFYFAMSQSRLASDVKKIHLYIFPPKTPITKHEILYTTISEGHSSHCYVTSIYGRGCRRIRIYMY